MVNDGITPGASPNEEFPIKVYVTGDAHFEGDNFVNWNETNAEPEFPGALQFYFTDEEPINPSGSQFTIDNNQKIAMTAAGENLQFSVNGSGLENTEIYGSIIADRVSLITARLFYDLRFRGVCLDGEAELSLISTTEVPQPIAVLGLESAAPAATGAAASPPPAPDPPPPSPGAPGAIAPATGPVAAGPYGAGPGPGPGPGAAPGGGPVGGGGGGP